MATTQTGQDFGHSMKAGIGDTDISNMKTFSYLKELLERKIKALVEGFEGAKNILKCKYGNGAYSWN